MEEEVELISETFTDNFTLSETEQIIDENNYSHITEPSLPNDVSNINSSNHCEAFDYIVMPRVNLDAHMIEA